MSEEISTSILIFVLCSVPSYTLSHLGTFEAADGRGEKERGKKRKMMEMNKGESLPRRLIGMQTITSWDGGEREREWASHSTNTGSAD